MNTPHDALITMIKQIEIDDSVNDDHRDELKRRVLDAFDNRATAPRGAADTTDTGSRPLRLVFGPRFARLAASIALLAAVVLTGRLLLTPHLALADIRKAVDSVQTAQYQMTITAPDRPEQKARVYVQEPGLLREERPGDVTRIRDLVHGRILELHTAEKLADLTEVPGVPKDKLPSNVVEQLRDLLRRAEAGEKGLAVTPLGGKDIAGHHTVGFTISSAEEAADDRSQLYTIWADAETALPVRVEQRILDFTVVMTDFVYNAELAAGLFSLDIPAGYHTKTTQLDVDLFSQPGEADLIKAMRLYAENGDGSLPRSIDDSTVRQLVELMSKKKPEAGVDPKQAVRDQVRKIMPITMQIGRAQAFLLSLGDKADAHFAADPVKLGEADKPVFWYRPGTAGAGQYHVIYGDLSVKELDHAPTAKSEPQAR
ncbi:MAG: hypothetical protein GC159_04855 [Phycisphaera sp.]|nr:hypothetical protein [Phycisphaera sp.]